VRRLFKPKADSLDRGFEISILRKGVDGVLEIAGGLLLLLITPATIDRLVVGLTQHELAGPRFLGDARPAFRERTHRAAPMLSQRDRHGTRDNLQRKQRKSNVGVEATKIIDLYSNLESIIPKVEVAGSIPVSRSKPQI
jgi:hypothetical protein